MGLVVRGDDRPLIAVLVVVLGLGTISGLLSCLLGQAFSEWATENLGWTSPLSYLLLAGLVALVFVVNTLLKKWIP